MEILYSVTLRYTSWILIDRLLMAVKPAGQGNYEEVEGLYDMGHCTNRLSIIFFDNNIIQFVRIFAPYALQVFNAYVGGLHHEYRRAA